MSSSSFRHTAQISIVVILFLVFGRDFFSATLDLVEFLLEEKIELGLDMIFEFEKIIKYKDEFSH